MIKKNYTLYNHISPGMSDMEKDMMKYIKPGGNWKDLPDKYNSKRLDGIRKSGGRTTYYGRLLPDKPSYTITTYFNRLPNGCNIHPTQDRIISIREGARLQSFFDSYKFESSNTSQYKQIGNAVPPMLGRFLANQLKNQLDNNTIFDLFAGAGGMSLGFLNEGFKLGGSNEIVESYFNTYIKNHRGKCDKDNMILGDITNNDIKNKVAEISKKNNVGVIIGGPPCQGLSLAGWRDPKDKRNQLFRDYVSVVEQIKPEVFIMENVPGLLTMSSGKLIIEVISLFKSIGYKTLQPFILSSENFGVPQRRKRVILIGYKNRKIKINTTPLFSYEDSSLPNPVNVGEAIFSLPEIGIKEGEYSTSFDYIPKSLYDLYISEIINFDEFYKKSIELIKK